MTTFFSFQDKLDTLPKVPKYDGTAMMGPSKDWYSLEVHALRARLALARELLEGSACSCFLEHRESGEHHKNVCNRCAFLARMDSETT